MREKWIKIATISLAALFLLSAAVLTVRNMANYPDAFSLYENKKLSKPETFSGKSLSDGSFLQSMEPAFSDHMAFREYWLKAYTALQMDVLNKPIVQGLVVQEDLLLPQYAAAEPEDSWPAAENMVKNLLKLQETVENYGGKFLFVGLPEQSSILGDRYPAAIPNNGETFANRQQALFETGAAAGLQMLNMNPVFLQSDDPTRLYCVSDHHYRLQGAYLTYTTICEALAAQGVEIPVLTEADFTWKALPNPFLGSLGRKLMGLWETEEPLWIYEPHQPIPFRRWDNGQEVAAEVFDLPENETNFVQYTAYMGGDQAETVIQTDRPALPDCLIFGDSFTNGLETFLYTSFDETRSLDLRHYTEMGILEYVQTHQPDVVICMQNDTVYLLQEGNGVIE